MGQGSLRLLDSEGREILAAIDDQPLRVELTLDIDPASAPDTITVEITGPDGTKETIEATRIDWGADRPLYRSELTTIDDVFSGVINTIRAIFADSPDPESGGHVHFEYDDLETDVQVFDSGLDARHWVTEQDLADRIRHHTNVGINLTAVRQALGDCPEGELRTKIEAEVDQRLAGTRETLHCLELSSEALDNPHWYDEQQIRVSQYWISVSETDRGRRWADGATAVARYGKEIVHGHIVSGVKDIVIGGYQMLVQTTGVAQVRTIFTGENELGQEVGFWDGRVVAFLDLVADGAMTGASMKFELDHLVPSTRSNVSQPAARSRYEGPDPATNAPEGSIVDPTTMGMTPAAVRAALRGSRRTNSYTLVRPTNPDALPHLQAGALPKPESLKSKTIGPLDTLIGAAPETRGLVGLFEPETGFFESAFRTSGLSDAETASRIDALRPGVARSLRHRATPGPSCGMRPWAATTSAVPSYTGATGKATFKLEAAGEIRIENGLIIDAKTGKPFAGDHDIYDYVDVRGVSVSSAVYDDMVAYSRESAFRAQHGAHKWWDPQRSDFAAGAYGTAKYEVARDIYEKIIAQHQGEEILICFPPAGPPIAIFAGTAPGPYLGHMPGSFSPVAAGSALKLPTEVFFPGVAGTVRQGLTFDETVRDWIHAEEEFQGSLESEADDDFFAEAATLVDKFDEDMRGDHDYDVDEFLTKTDDEPDDEPDEDSSPIAEERAHRVGSDPAPAAPSPAGLFGCSLPLLIAVVVAAVAALSLALWFGGGTDDDVAVVVPDETAADPEAVTAAETATAPSTDPESSAEPDSQDETSSSGTTDSSSTGSTEAQPAVVEGTDAEGNTTFTTEYEGRRYVATVPAEAAEGSQVPWTVCVTDLATGEAVTDTNVFITMARGEPSNPNASHGNQPVGIDGCGAGLLLLFESLGLIDVYTSDGLVAWILGQILIVPA